AAMCKRKRPLSLVCPEWYGKPETDCFDMVIEMPYEDPKVNLKMENQICSPQSWKWIMRKFPKIVSFEFFQKELYFPQLLSLLSHWKNDLRILKVIIIKTETPRTIATGSEWNQLLDSLKGLTYINLIN